MAETAYYAMIGSERVGPMSLAELRNLPLTPSTPVWRTGMPNWADASTFPELADRFGMMPPPSQAPSPAYGGGYGQPAGGGYQQPSPGYQQGAYNPGYGNNDGRPPMPDNYLAWSIVATLLCCLPTGIVAIIYSSKVSSRYNEGDYDGALRAASSAKTWCIVSVVAALLWVVLYFGLFMLGALGSLADL